MRKKINYIILFLFVAQYSIAQDFHLSQYDMAPQYLNPALTGMYCGEKGDYRFYTDYRSQWMSSSLKPYTTAFLAFDMTDEKWNRDFGFGAYLIDNSAGVSSVRTINFMLSAAYNITRESNGKHYLTTGLQFGMMNKSFDPNSFTYDVQYSESMGGFNTGIPNGENYSKNSLLGFDVNYGIFYKYTEFGKKAHPFGGLSIYHVTQPNESFTSTKVKTPMRFNFHGGCDIMVSDIFKLTPRFLYMNQARASEVNVGILAYNKIKGTPYSTILQFDYRNQDAVILGIGMKQNDHSFRLSYDVNTSSLGSHSGGIGSWEFSLILSGIKGRPLFSRLDRGSKFQ